MRFRFACAVNFQSALSTYTLANGSPPVNSGKGIPGENRRPFDRWHGQPELRHWRIGKAVTRTGINLRQLADLLRLSQTTVSRALNGYPEVGEATRARVLEAAERHDYRPNARARGLATGRTMAVASIVPAGSTHEVVNPVYSDFIAGASEVLTAAQYDLMLTVVSGADEEALYRRMASRGGVDGLIIHAPRWNDPRLRLLQRTGLPFVVHGRFSQDDHSYSWVDLDNAEAFAGATQRLLALGHRRIALINGLVDMDFARRRAEGHALAISAHGLPPESALVRHGEMTEAHGYTTTMELLGADVPPTAILASSWIVALGVERALLTRGLMPGRDISVVTHDDKLSYFDTGPGNRFAAIVSPVRDHGRRVADMLLRLVADTSAGPLHDRLRAEFVPGPSMGPPPAA